MAGYQAPRGMRDLLPEEAAGFDALAAVVLARAMRYGYPRIETPTLEERAVFVKSSGESSDIVGKEMYEVSQQGEGGLVLRPEGTPGVARALLEHGLHKSPRPIRFSYFEPMFRGQRPQKLRYRQFWQWGLECFGAEEAVADVEIIEFTNGFFREVGLTGYEIQINTIGDAKCRPKVRAALTAYFSAHREKLSPVSQRRVDTNVLRVLDSKEPADREIVKGAPRILDLLCEEDRAHFTEVQDGLTAVGIEFKVVPTLVRGLDYYTRTVTEFALTAPEFQGIAVAGGGRYDGMVKVMGGDDLPGTGIAGGVDVLYYAMRQEGIAVADEPKPDVYVVSAQAGDAANRLTLAAGLREAGFAVAIDYSRRTLDKQLESAVKHGAKIAIIAGTPEARGGNVVVRDLVKKEQVVKRLAAVVTEVKRRVVPRPIPKLWRAPTDPGDIEPGAAGEAPFLIDPRN